MLYAGAIGKEKTAIYGNSGFLLRFHRAHGTIQNFWRSISKPCDKKIVKKSVKKSFKKIFKKYL